jgi:AraC-like DNA-binding protein
MVRSLSGASAVRVVEAGSFAVDAHAHDWPILSLYVMGDVIKTHEDGAVRVNGPAAMLHGPGEFHSNCVRDAGLEQLDIQFDPTWLPSTTFLTKERRVRIWRGGKVAAEANRLRLKWIDPQISESELAVATTSLLEIAFREEAEAQPPPWLEAVRQRLEAETPWSTDRIARQLDLHPGWLAQAYRSLTGEGIGQTSQRLRVERAVKLLRGTEFEAADIAAAAGFCDQSHMIRSFKRLLGRGPSQVRGERDLLRPVSPSSARANLRSKAFMG